MSLFDNLLAGVLEEEQKTAGQDGGKQDSSKKKQLIKKLADRVAEIEQTQGVVKERERLVVAKEKQLETKEAVLKKHRQELVQKLEKVSTLNSQEAKQLLLDSVEKDLKSDIARRIREAEEEIKHHSEDKAKEILADALAHGVTDYVAEYTVSTVSLPNEEIKGRIIGREGRNIRAFERATGVEIELDEANVIHLSSFDSVRREIARRSLEKLIRDRRIQPQRIGEVVEKTKTEIDKILFEEGEKLCHAVKVYQLHPDLIRLLGRFKFRFSYGQNLIVHTLEETKIGVQLAYELKADVNVVKLGCLLHDIGKVVGEEEGTHVQIGVKVARKYHVPEPVIKCIEEHHEDKPISTVESRLVWIADAASGSRPGARYEPHEEYVQRMEQIEKIAKKFDQVKETYAYQAGRQVMVMVNPKITKDDELIVLANKIGKKLEEEVSYAGQIKITCIRETQASEMTKAK